MKGIILVSLLSLSTTSEAFAPQGLHSVPKSRVSEIFASKDEGVVQKDGFRDWKVAATTFMLGCGIIGASIAFPGSALADEYGRETEAPTLFTGETTMICVKRGPLGACTKTETRTSDNDNDKSNKYFNDPQESLKEKYSAAQFQKVNQEKEDNANELIAKLKQQSVDNKDKNDKIIRAKTLQNDMGASFGPLDSQVAILNSDGESYQLLKGAQAMRLKKAGYIKDKRFVTQPTQEVIDEAYDAPLTGPQAFVGGVLKGIFGEGDDL